ncbi:tyrosyl-DNA phosphodiesterase 1 isoform X1 [Patella vulgata]|uniref:tyrosyl-DNA phosphodiesterase 1 isoform X1 n=1 Tax=Patella vulgata TaxID=6465 RepID=UPI0024A87E21|nr:tyrosyl-DNA phosphodiesterase 1 isoform X1 [Patella vulgata]XP_055957199.1 tyrosyl-DNA phosphodiesterase 1 isoform X1 [Patella vulgata]
MSLQKGAHSISDSDSDETIEPDPWDKNSPDLFDSASEDDKKKALIPLPEKQKLKTVVSSNSKKESPVSQNKKQKSMTDSGNSQEIKKQSIKKQKSLHELSDSDSEVERIKEKILKLKKITSSGEKVFAKLVNEETKKEECKYGSKCFRRNPSHLAEYSHPKNCSPAKRKLEDVPEYSPSKKTKHEVTASTSTCNKSNKTCQELFRENQPFSFFLTKVTGIRSEYNDSAAVHISEILSEDMGNLVESCQFNYMYNIDWLVQQYPKSFRSKPLLLVHGEQRTSQANLQLDASKYPNIKLCQARLDIMYGTHHTKMMLLLYDTGLRVVITTANAIEGDWYQKTQGVWISPVFPKLPGDGGTNLGESPTNFKKDLIQYLTAYRSPKLTQWENHIKAHDFSSARVFIIGSVPGRHTDRVKDAWGHLKLRKVLQNYGPPFKNIKDWPVIGQFSSIGSLGPTEDSWVCGEWLKSLTAAKGIGLTSSLSSKLQLIFPSVDNVRISLEGYGAGGSIPYSIHTAQKQKYIHQYFRQWKSEGRGRSRAAPHIKTYVRPNPEFNEAAWFLVTSANLSKAAWGALEKQGSQLMIRSYEIGVLFLPQYFNDEETFPITSDVRKSLNQKKATFPLPYDLPPSRYEKGDRPWMWDVPCVHLPDTNGKKYCPPMK